MKGYLNRVSISSIQDLFKEVKKVIIKDSEYNDEWWYEDKLEYLRNFSIFGPASIPVISLLDDRKTLICLKETNKLLTLKYFLEGNMKVPVNLLFRPTERFSDYYYDINKLPIDEMNKFLRLEFYIKVITNTTGLDWSEVEKIYRNL